MGLREGYKETEVGIIPDDWTVKQLGEIGVFSKGSGIRKDEALTGDIPCIRYGELYTSYNNFIDQFYSSISKDVANTAKLLKTGDILFAGSGETKEEIGKCVAFLNSFEAYAGGDIVILSPEKVSSLFLGYLLNAPIIQKQKASRGQGDAVVHISATQLANISIPLPSNKSEQTTIANALYDMDALISQTKKLIYKKESIKQAVMQRLLSPIDDHGKLKKGWITKSLGEVAKTIKSGGTPLTSKKEYYNGTIPFLSISDMTEQGKYLRSTSSSISELGLANSSSWLVPKGFLIYSMYASVGLVSITKIDLAISQAVLGITFKDTTCLEFMYYYLTDMQKAIFKFISEGTQKNLNARTVKGLEIHIPSLIVQESIANVLSEMDSHISILKLKLQKFQFLKQGMQHSLLTGKIRIYTPKHESASAIRT